MRAIKFRGKTCSNPEWAYGDLINFGNNVLSIGSYTPIGYELKRRVDSDTVGQFTGLYDKNGDEIYEGDIVRHDENGKCYSIIYEELMFRFAPNDDCFAFLNHPELLEVVGNIHDNPDMIKKGGEQ